MAFLSFVALLDWMLENSSQKASYAILLDKLKSIAKRLEGLCTTPLGVTFIILTVGATGILRAAYAKEKTAEISRFENKFK